MSKAAFSVGSSSLCSPFPCNQEWLSFLIERAAGLGGLGDRFVHTSTRRDEDRPTASSMEAAFLLRIPVSPSFQMLFHLINPDSHGAADPPGPTQTLSGSSVLYLIQPIGGGEFTAPPRSGHDPSAAPLSLPLSRQQAFKLFQGFQGNRVVPVSPLVSALTIKHNCRDVIVFGYLAICFKCILTISRTLGHV